jgi:hypothetical protein
MNEQDQQIAIAEFCGWKDLHRPSGIMEMPNKSSVGVQQYSYPPNYTTDLNAMHEAEIKLPDEETKRNYVANLVCLMKPGQFTVFDPTASQRAEALLRTIGKWPLL